MENERKKRLKQVIAIIIALLIIIQTSYKTTQLLWKNQAEEVLLYGESDISEEIIQGTNLDERILMIPIYGEIGGSVGSLLEDGTTYDHELILESIEYASQDPSIKGILLDVDSPGGAVYETAEVHQRLQELAAEKQLPIYTTVGVSAASGGYYISSLSDKIFASKESIVGSIGVIMNFWDYSNLMDRVGIQDNTIKTGEFKDTGSSTREMTDVERTYLQDYVDSSFQRFIDVVADGRGISRKDVEKIADGRIFDGEQALEVGLIDEIGYKKEAIEGLSETLKIDDPQVFMYTKNKGNVLFDQLPQIPFLNKLNDTIRKNEIIFELIQQMENSHLPSFSYIYGGN